MQFLGPAAAKATNQESRSRGRCEGYLRHEISLSAARTAVVVGRLRGRPKISMQDRPIDVADMSTIPVSVVLPNVLLISRFALCRF